MTNSDKIKYCTKSGKKYYKQFMIFITLLSILIIGIFTFKNVLLSYLYNGIMKQYNYNYAFVTYSSIDKKEDVINNLNKINHIKETFNDYENEISIYLEKIDDKEYKGSFYLVGKSNLDLKKMSKYYQNNNDIICPANFYYSDDIEKNKFIKRSDVLKLSRGNRFKTYYYKILDKNDNSIKTNLELNVIDMFSNGNYEIDENICYASRSLLTEIFNNAYPIDYFGNQIDSLMISIDNSKNHQYVKEKVESLGYDFSDVYYIDYSFINSIKKLSVLLMILSIFFVILLIINMNKKRYYDKIKEFNILRTIGYSNKEIKSILTSDIIIILSSSIIISFVVIILLICIIKLIIYNYPFIIGKLVLPYNYKSLILFYLIYTIIFIGSSKIYYLKLLKAQDKIK